MSTINEGDDILLNQSFVERSDAAKESPGQRFPAGFSFVKPTKLSHIMSTPNLQEQATEKQEAIRKWEADDLFPSSTKEAPAAFTSPDRNEQQRYSRMRSGSLPEEPLGTSFCRLESGHYGGRNIDPSSPFRTRANIFNTDLPLLVKAADTGLKCGLTPILADGAMGGTYFLRSASLTSIESGSVDGNGRGCVVVFKPWDQEPHAPNNPYESSPPLDGGATSLLSYRVGNIVPGFGMYREVAAYLLDHHGFAGVPPTAIARVQHPAFHQDSASAAKVGAIQAFVSSECSAEDMGYSKFLADDIYRIALLDLRLCNLDRHEGNLLVAKSNPYQVHTRATTLASPCDVSSTATDSSRVSSSEVPLGLARSAPASFPSIFSSSPKTTDGDGVAALLSPAATYERTGYYRLIPIDHGYCLPHLLNIHEAHFAWLHWSPVRTKELPAYVLEYIASLDYEADVRVLTHNIGAAVPNSSLWTLFVCTTLLQAGVLRFHWSLHDIGALFVSGMWAHRLGDREPWCSWWRNAHRSRGKEDETMCPLQYMINDAVRRTLGSSREAGTTLATAGKVSADDSVAVVDSTDVSPRSVSGALLRSPKAGSGKRTSPERSKTPQASSQSMEANDATEGQWASVPLTDAMLTRAMAMHDGATLKHYLVTGMNTLLQVISDTLSAVHDS